MDSVPGPQPSPRPLQACPSGVPLGLRGQTGSIIRTHEKKPPASPAPASRPRPGPACALWGISSLLTSRRGGGKWTPWGRVLSRGACPRPTVCRCDGTAAQPWGRDSQPGAPTAPAPCLRRRALGLCRLPSKSVLCAVGQGVADCRLPAPPHPTGLLGAGTSPRGCECRGHAVLDAASCSSREGGLRKVGRPAVSGDHLGPDTDVP